MATTTRKTPQDHLPKKDNTVKAEASGDDITVEHNGVTYMIARDNADNLELFEFIEDEKYMKAVRGFLGADQWAKYKDSVRTEDGRVPAEGFEEFLDAVMSAIGGEKDSAPN